MRTVYSTTLGGKTIPLLVNVPVLLLNLFLLASCPNLLFKSSLLSSGGISPGAKYVLRSASGSIIGATIFLSLSSLVSEGSNVCSYILVVAPEAYFAITSTL